jgi:hypothetical protein
MARIPVYEQTTTPSGLIQGGKLSSAYVASPVGRAISDVAQVGQQFVKAFDHQDALIAEEKLTQLREEQSRLALDENEGFLNKRGRDAIEKDANGNTLQDQYMSKFSASKARISAGMTENQLIKFNQKSQLLDLDFKQQILKHTINEADKYADDVFKSTLDTEQRLLGNDYNNPVAFKVSLERVMQSVNAYADRKGWSDEKRMEEINQQTSKLHASVLTGAIAKEDMSFADSYVKANKNQLSADDNIKFNKFLDQHRYFYRAELTQKVSNSNAMAMDGIVDPSPISYNEFRKAFGDADAQKQYRSYQDNQLLAKDISGLKAMPIGEIDAFLSTKRPVAGPNYEMQEKRYNVMFNAAKQVATMRDKDPAMAAISVSPIVNQNYQKMTQLMSDPSASPEERTMAVNQYAVSAAAEQDRLGISQVRLLPKSYVDYIGSRLQGAKTGEELSDNITAMSKQWGSNWNTVYKQLVQDKAMPAAGVVIGSGMTSKAAADLAIASKYKDDDLIKGLPQGTKKDVSESVSGQLEDFRATMIGGNGTARTIGSVDTYNIFYEQTNKLALYYHSQGFSVSDAAKMAAKETINSKYDFANSYRVPKDSQVTIREVEQAQSYLLNNLNQLDLQIPETLRKDEFVKGDYIKNVKRKSYWVTAPDESGLVLFNSDSNSNILLANGQPVQYTWQELKDMARARSLNKATLTIREQMFPSTK